MNPESIPPSTPPAAAWRPISRLPEGNAILQISPGEAGRLWLATSTGLFIRQESVWYTLEAEGQALGAVSALLALGRLVLAGGPPQGIARSLTAGREWGPCLVEQARRPVTCFAASPRFSQDNVLLAGTEGDGVLRSVDGGRSWTLANFGLRDFTVLCLAAGGAWERKEPAFAGTVSGVYASPNGGRAWRFSGLEGQAVQALALSPDFAEDRTLFAGLETGGLQVSRDGGASWQAAGIAVPGEELAVNAVLCRPGGSVLAASGAGVWRSPDLGLSWQAVPQAPQDIFCLAEAEGVIYAGGAESGLWWSEDGGNEWGNE